MSRIRTKVQANGKTRYYPLTWVDGKETPLGGFRTKTDAVNMLNKAEKEIANGTYGKAKPPTFGEFYEKWIASKHNLKKSSLLSYEHSFKLHILPTFGEMSLDKIGPVDVQAWVNDLAESDLSPPTVGKCFRYFRACMKQAEAWGKIDKAPTVKINLPRPSYEEMTFLEYSEIVRVLNVTEEPEKTLFSVLAFSGLRLGEALALRWKDIDFGVSRIRVARSWSLGEFTSPKTKTSKRNVKMMPVLEKVLIEHRQRQGRPQQDALLFSFDGTQPLDPANVRKRFLEALDAAGVGHCTLHSLRHSYASLMLSVGTSVKDLQNALGNASATITLNVYSHLMKEDMDKPVADARQDY